MCFYHDDADWHASVYEDNVLAAEKKARCHECHCWIHPGEWCRDIFIQERETCRVCQLDDDYDDEPDSELEPCAEGECDYGEQFQYVRCEACDKVIRAVEAVERDAGCTGNSITPPLIKLYEAMTYEENEYGDRARELYPEVAGHLWRFGEVWDYENGWSRADLESVDELGGEA